MHDEEERALAPVAAHRDLSTITQAEFEERLRSMQLGRARVLEIKKKAMQDGIHYGTIPGTNKPTILKSGVETLSQMYGLALICDDPHITFGDGVTSPHILVRMTCRAHRGSADGPVIATGHGARSSWEKKYRYRKASPACPACGKTGPLRVDQANREWYCWRKKDGCGQRFGFDSPAADALKGFSDVTENPDPYEALNTIVKMCAKSARADAVITATASSDLFTQDLEDMERYERTIEGEWAEVPQEGSAEPSVQAPPTPEPVRRPPPPPDSKPEQLAGAAVVAMRIPTEATRQALLRVVQALPEETAKKWATELKKLPETEVAYQKAIEKGLQIIGQATQRQRAQESGQGVRR